MTEQILIRPFRVDDIPGLAGLTNELGYPTTVEQMQARMEQITRLDGHWTFVAVIEEAIAGYIGINKHYFWEQDGYFIRIQALVVKKECRRGGVGRALIQHAEDWAGKQGAKIILLNCGNREERQAAHKFYPKMGFEAKSTGYVKRLE